MADWKGVDGRDCRDWAGRALLLILQLLTGPKVGAPNTEEFLFPGEEEVFVMVVVALAGQTQG